MLNTTIISLTKLNVLQERVCSPINHLCTKIDSATPLWDGPIKMCEQIEKDPFAVETVVIEAKKRNNLFSGINAPRLYHAILCRVYIILYYRHHDDKSFQEIVFPSLKTNMGVYSRDYLKTINEQIENILKQEELLRKMQEDKKKDVKPLFKYVMHSGIEADHLCLEYNEERLFRKMSDVIKQFLEMYDTRQDVANVWYNAKEVVHTLKNIKRPELIIDRIATALVAGQIFNGYKGSQIVLICAYAMIRSSKKNEHFIPFINEMESLPEDQNSDLEVIKSHIDMINTWLTQNQPFDDYDYIGDTTADNVTYTDADIKRIRQQIIEQESNKRAKLEQEIEGFKVREDNLKQQILTLRNKLKDQETKKNVESADEEIESLKNDLMAFKTRDKKGKEFPVFTAKQIAIFLKAILLEHNSLTNNVKKLSPLVQRFGGGLAPTTAENSLGYEVTQKECDEIEMIFRDYAPAIGTIIKKYPEEFKKRKESKLLENFKNNS